MTTTTSQQLLDAAAQSQARQSMYARRKRTNRIALALGVRGLVNVQYAVKGDAINVIEDDGTRQVLTWLRDLFGLGLIEENLAWYLMSGRLSVPRAQAVSAYRERLIARLRPHAADLVDAFGYGPEHIRASIASGAERERQDEARAYMRAQRESGNAPIEEKAMQAEEKLKQQKAGANA